MRKSILATVFASGLIFAADRVTAIGKVTDADANDRTADLE